MTESTLQISLLGSVGARQGFPPFRRRFAALTRAIRSDGSRQLLERRCVFIKVIQDNWGWLCEIVLRGCGVCAKSASAGIRGLVYGCISSGGCTATKLL